MLLLITLRWEAVPGGAIIETASVRSSSDAQHASRHDLSAGAQCAASGRHGPLQGGLPPGAALVPGRLSSSHVHVAPGWHVGV